MLKIIHAYKSGVHALIIDGHAGYAEHGSDIVCASASMLAYTLANEVARRGEAHELTAKPIIALSPGSARIVCAPTEKVRREVDMIFDVFSGGFRLLAENYPAHVEFHENNDASPERA